MMSNDLSQIAVITKNELIKCVRGRKFLVSIAIVVVVFLLITGLQFMTGGWDRLTNMGNLTSTYLTTLPLVIALVVALLSSISIVSEFEERTALILFTRPVRRTSILIGKMLSCTILEAGIILIYYIFVLLVGVIKIDDLDFGIVISYAFALLYAFAASGIAFIISSFLKKGSVCTIISLLLLLLVVPITSSMMATDGGENWYMIDQAGNTIYTGIPEYVDQSNEGREKFIEVVESAKDILSGITSEETKEAIANLVAFMQTETFQELDEETQNAMIYIVENLSKDYPKEIGGMIAVLEMLVKSSAFAPMEYPDLVKEALVLIIWGFIGYLISWVRFVRREF